jgi:hypothetical protein
VAVARDSLPDGFARPLQCEASGISLGGHMLHVKKLTARLEYATDLRERGSWRLDRAENKGSDDEIEAVWPIGKALRTRVDHLGW